MQQENGFVMHFRAIMEDLDAKSKKKKKKNQLPAEHKQKK